MEEKTDKGHHRGVSVGGFFSSAGTEQALCHVRKHHIWSLTLERGTGSGSSNCRLTEGSVLEEAVLSSMWIL